MTIKKIKQLEKKFGCKICPRCLGDNVKFISHFFECKNCGLNWEEHKKEIIYYC